MSVATEVPVRQMWLGDRWAQAADGGEVTSVNPTTGQPIARVPDATAQDVAHAVAVAADAQRAWAGLPWQRRAAALHALADAVHDDAERLARLDVEDSGNPLTGMRNDALSAPEEIRYFAGIAAEAKGFTVPTAGDTLTFTERSPYGVVGRIIPFNHPLKFAAAKIAAPLAAGNAVVLKPSEQAPLSALELARIALDVLPQGVLSVVTGRGATTGAALVAHPAVPRVAFTGSVPTGRAILRAAAEEFKHVTLELGGKNPLVVFPDVDPAAAARAAVAGMNFARCSGQSCGSTSRVYVHRSIAPAFVDALATAVAALRVGDPMAEDTDVGPVAFREHYDRVLGYLDTGRREGATVLVGGGRPADRPDGFFVEPTVFVDVTDEMTIAREEIFGPVMCVLVWDDVDDVVRRANATSLGLTANVWTRDVTTAHRVARALEAGYVFVNGTGRRPVGGPFGGWKHSGLGQEHALAELLSYTREKTTSVTLEGPR